MHWEPQRQARELLLSLSDTQHRAVGSAGGRQSLTGGCKEANSEKALEHPAEGLDLLLNVTEVCVFDLLIFAESM